MNEVEEIMIVLQTKGDIVEPLRTLFNDKTKI